MKGVKLIHWMKGIYFLFIYQNILPNLTVKSTEIELITPSNQRFSAKYYSFWNFTHLPVVYLQHGINVDGIEDKRIVKLAQSIAACGYIVITPEFPEVKKLLLNQISITVNNVNLCFTEISRKFQRKVGYISVCFLAGLGLISLSKKSNKLNLSSMMLIGCYADFEKTIINILENFTKDSYASYVFFYNYIDLAFENVNDLKELFHQLAILDLDYHYIENHIISNLHKKLSSKEKIIFNKLCTDNNFRLLVGNLICNKLTEKYLNIYSPLQYMNYIDFPLSILHGKDDFVISFSNSIELYNSLIKKESSSLVISELITHGRTRNLFNTGLLKIFSLAYAFASFFSKLEN